MDIASLAISCRHRLVQDGFALVEGLLTAEELEELQMEADTLYELAQEGQATAASPADPGSGPAWSSDAVSSCIYETLPGHQLEHMPALRRDDAAYRQRRGLWPLRAAVWRLLFQSRLTELVLALLGSGAVLFNDQYIIKPPGGAQGGSSASAFARHRDSDWCSGTGVDYKPYISVWCALDDMSTANGCLVVWPGSHRPAAAARKEQQQDVARWESFRRQQDKQRLVQSSTGQQQQRQQGQQQRQPESSHEGAGCAPLALETRAGTVIITSDRVLHASGRNCTQHFRRAWMPQFAAGELTWRRSGLPVSLAILLRPSGIE